VNTKAKETFIRAKAIDNQRSPTSDKVLWSRHAIAKLVVEGWQRSDVETALQTCLVIEDYPIIGRPMPDCLVLGF
jgi:hypothetical protein